MNVLVILSKPSFKRIFNTMCLCICKILSDTPRMLSAQGKITLSLLQLRQTWNDGTRAAASSMLDLLN
jgi:hypothetical protein